MSFTGREKHDISLADAAVLTARYRATVPVSARKAGFFGRDAIETILAQVDCVGIRYYHGIDDNDEPVIVLTGVTVDENDLFNGRLMDFSQPCPPRCSADNPLNS